MPLERSIRAAIPGIPLPLSVAAQGIPLGTSVEGILTSPTTAVHFQQEMLKELRVISERIGVLSGETPVEQQQVKAAARGRTPSPASEGTVIRTSAMAGEEVPAAPSGIDQYGRMSRYFGSRSPDPQEPLGGFSLANLRQDVGRMAQERLGNATWGPQFQQDSSGRWHDPQGRFVRGDDPGLQDFLKRESVMMAMRGGAATLAAGGKLSQAGMGALATAPGGVAVLRGVGVVTGVAHGIDALAGVAERQRAQNASWQRIMGGTNFEGFGERVQQNLFALGQFGFMNPEEAERLYRGVAETGLRGAGRDRAEQFALQAYRRHGMTVDQSLQIINTAAETGQESLMGLSAALDAVTESARDAGVNTERARQAFVDSWTTFSQTLGGQAAVSAAAGVTAATTALGPEFQGVSGGPGEMQLRMQAAQMRGMTLNQYLSAGRQPGNEQMFLQDWTQLVRQSTAITMRPETAAAFAQFQGRKDLSDAERAQLADLVLQSGIDITGQMAVLQQMGVQGLTLANAPEFIGQMLIGNWDPVREQQRMVQESATRRIDTGIPLGEVSRSTQASGIVSDEFKELERRVGQSDVGGFFSFSDDAIRQYFLEDVLRTGRAGGISERLATQADVRQGITQVTVMDNGRPKTVSLKEAMRKYRDQLDAGTAIVAEGQGEGGTISQALGMPGDTSLGTPGGAPSQGQVMLGATPELRRLIAPVSATPGIFIDPASGWEQPPTQVMPDARPSGSD